MTRAHRSVGEHDGEHSAAWPAPAPPVRRTPAPVAAEHAAPTAGIGDIGNGDIGSLTLSELAVAADARRTDPTSLLRGPARARTRDDLELAARLPEPVATLVVDLARLEPATAAVLAGMIERYAAADRRRRPPTP